MSLSFNLLDYLLEESVNPLSDSKMIEEMVKNLYFTQGNKHFGFRVEPDEGRPSFGCEYFKVYADENKRIGIPFNRIEFRNPYYTEHNMNTKEPKWNLNSGEKKIMDNYLRRVRYDAGNMTGFQVLICDYNRIMFQMSDEETKKNLTTNLIYPKALPFDLKQPDYRNLNYR